MSPAMNERLVRKRVIFTTKNTVQVGKLRCSVVVLL